ncbi:MAG: DNA-3-methyladenine glycosylase [Solirubrobacteraceae bacterium]
MTELRLECVPRSPLRLPGGGMDGVLRRRGAVIERLLHLDGQPVVVRAAHTGGGSRVLLGAQAASRGLCERALTRMRFALGIDDDLSAFYSRFRGDPLLGRAIRNAPWLRPPRRPEPFEALAWAVCEQLIEYPRAAAIERRIVRALGERCARTELRDVPSAERLAGAAPALLESFDLSAGRALALIRAAREVAHGRVDLLDPDHERGWQRLRKIHGIGSWTIEILALQGQGRFDQLPAGDVGLLKLVGRLQSGGDPHARVQEQEVRQFFAPYAPWGGLAATYAFRAGSTRPRPAGIRL